MIKKNKNILLVSREMADKEIMKRVHANAMDLPINALLDLSKSAGELQKIQNGDGNTPGRSTITKEMVISAYNKMKTEGNVGKLFVKDYPSGSFSPLMLEQLVQSFKIERGITFDVIFVDYIGIMKSDLLSPSAGLYSYIKSIAEEVRATAKKLNLPIISASQLNRSATNNISEADNSNVSDSMGTVMTADFMLFLLQNEEMKEKKEIVCKITKNRFAGRTDTWMMSIDYEHMRFNDMLVQNAGEDIRTIDITTASFGSSGPKIDDDFGIITAKKQERAEVFAAKEVKDIIREDYEKIQQSDQPKKDPFVNDLDLLYKELGL
jgi:replicative DNA helicase